MNMELKDKIAVITGGSIGIGLAIAEGLAREGVHLALVARGEERVKQAAADLSTKYGVQAIGIRADVAKSEDVAAILAEVEKVYGAVDILINNAGTGSNETILEAADEKWQYYWDLHVMAAVRLGRGFAPMMQKRGAGVIINNASICAKQPLFYEPIYNTTKAALMMFSKCMSNEFIKFNIRVNCVNPGLVLTPDWWKTATQLTAGTDQTPTQYLDKIAKDFTPIGRFGSPEELADFFVFLCSPRASYCVGSSFYVDGGWLNVVA
jgi:3-oxoacyl-[acyl-carrier protein] reductase